MKKGLGVVFPVSRADDSELIKKVMNLFKRHQVPAFDAHGHLDREGTFDPVYYEHANVDPQAMASTYSLPAKQLATRYLHEGKAYQDIADFEKRVRRQIEIRRKSGVGRLDTCIDTTPDIGLEPFNVALRLRDEYQRSGFTLKIGAYALWGFKDPDANSDRLDVFYEASKKADFLCGLPERDVERADGVKRVGFEGHIRIVLQRAIELGIPAHFHVDQANDPREDGTERLISSVRAIRSREADATEPMVWAVHVISPSSYPEERFWQLVSDLRELRIGVICCPRAAISMRQLRCLSSPTHNCIARVPEMLLGGVQVRIGSDNVSDVFVPDGNGDLVRAEIPTFANALRFYPSEVLFRLAAGHPLNESDRELVRSVVGENYVSLKSRYLRDRQEEASKLSPWTMPPY